MRTKDLFLVFRGPRRASAGSSPPFSSRLESVCAHTLGSGERNPTGIDKEKVVVASSIMSVRSIRSTFYSDYSNRGIVHDEKDRAVDHFCQHS